MNKKINETNLGEKLILFKLKLHLQTGKNKHLSQFGSLENQNILLCLCALPETAASLLLQQQKLQLDPG